MVGISRTKRTGGFFNKPVKERTPIVKTTLYRQVKKTEKINAHLANRKPAVTEYFEKLDLQIGDFKKAYRQYNHDEQELEENLRQLADRNKKLIIRLTHFIEAYNQAVDSLRSFDHAFNTHYLMDIEFLLQSSKYRLKDFGIHANPDCTIEVDHELFLRKIEKDKSIFPYLFNKKHGFFIKLCDIFRHIKVPLSPTSQYSETNVEGSIIDEHI